MSCVFSEIQVYPIRNDDVLINWTLRSDFKYSGSLRFTVQFSRSGNPNSNDWENVATVNSAGGIVFSISDTKRRTWSTFEQWFYRVRLQTIGVIDDSDVVTGTYYSYVESSWGSLTRQDRLVVREIFRQYNKSMVKKSGSQGLLYKRRHWGEPAPPGVVRDQITGEIIHTHHPVSAGTGYQGGYYDPFSYWVDIVTTGNLELDQNEVGTTAEKSMVVKALSWPRPRPMDLWRNCVNNKWYKIIECEPKAHVRHMPIIYQIIMDELPPTDQVYDI